MYTAFAYLYCDCNIIYDFNVMPNVPHTAVLMCDDYLYHHSPMGLLIAAYVALFKYRQCVIVRVVDVNAMIICILTRLCIVTHVPACNYTAHVACACKAARSWRADGCICRLHATKRT
jgi:hypothetical protein